VGQGSDKKCRLKISAIQRLEDKLAERFGDRPSDSVVADTYTIDRGTVGKVRNGREWVKRNSIERLLTPFNLYLLDEDYEQDLSQPSQSSPRPQPNPFGKPIECLEHLWTSRRREEYRQLKEAIGKGGSQAIVGPAGCGKSSMVRLLGREMGASVMHLDMHLVRDEGSFFDRLCDALDLESVDSPSRAMLKIEKQLKKLKELQVLCLDEIHVLKDERFFPEATRNWLRGMVGSSDPKLRLVVTSQRELRELFPDSSMRSSPLADFFDGQTLRLEALTRDQVVEFVDRGLRGTEVKFSEAQVEVLWAESGGSLTRLHRSAQKLYDELERG
jgi:type II secretory pathway predicted ATPase ExeA